MSLPAAEPLAPLIFWCVNLYLSISRFGFDVFLPAFGLCSLNALLDIFVNYVSWFDAFLHRLAHTSIGFSSLLLLHLEVCPGAFSHWAFPISLAKLCIMLFWT